MCFYLLIGFWFTRPIAANAYQNAFVTNRVGNFVLLLGILGFYLITGSFKFQDLFKIFNDSIINNNEINSSFAMLCALLFLGAVAKSAQFPLHVWLSDAIEGPTTISALIHAATMVAVGIFLVARLLPLFIAIPYIMNIISLIGIIMVLLGATLAHGSYGWFNQIYATLSQRDIKRSLAYSTMAQLGYIMLALGIGSYRATLFHLITHAYSKVLLFLGSGSIIHSIEPIVGYSLAKSQNMVLMDVGLTTFYMFHMYLLTFKWHLRSNFQNYSKHTNSSFYSISIWGQEGSKPVSSNLLLTIRNNNDNSSFSNCSFSNRYKIASYVRTMQSSFSTHFLNKNSYTLLYPHESDNTMLFPLLILAIFTLFIGCIGSYFGHEVMEVDILSKWLTPSIKLFHENSTDEDWFKFLMNAFYSVSIAYFGIFITSVLYGSIYLDRQNLYLINSFAKIDSKIRIRLEQIINVIYNWSYNRGYIDVYYEKVFIRGVQGFAQLVHSFDRRVIDGVTNGIGVASFFLG
ncbi:unnamed protein product [Victoria cruziana]